jgi:hypothetical protein
VTPAAKPDTLGSLRLRAERAEARAEKAEARVTELEGQNATLKFNAAATPKLQPIPQRHGWDVE